MTDALTAAQAYGQIAKIASNAPQSSATPDLAKPDFGALVQDAVAQTTNVVQAGEAAAGGVAAGDANLVDVVTAVSAAEVSLEAAIAVRNRVIEAYQEILRMPI